MNYYLLFIIALTFVIQSSTAYSSYTVKKIPKLKVSDDLDKDSLKEAINRQLVNFETYGIPAQFRKLGNIELTDEKLKGSLLKFKELLEENKSITGLSEIINKNFITYKIEDASKKQKDVTLTGFYHIELQGSLTKSESFTYPIYRCPEDNLGKKFTRKEIDRYGVLDGLDLEILWINDPFRAFDLHIQGSGTVVLDDGKRVQLNYACSNNYPFARTKKNSTDDLLENKRYIFFQETNHGPLGTNKTILTRGRSIATDKRVFPLGGIAVITFKKPVISENYKAKYIPVSRFVIDQSAGNAISGPYGADLYFGEGKLAEYEALHMYDRKSALYYLVKK